MKNFLHLFSVCFFTLFGCTEKELDPDKPVYVTISTSMGDVTVMLYDDTPLHRDNFIRLCRENTYNNVLFHRIIKDFVVQGGDPASKAKDPDAVYGDGDGGYTVPAEILPNHFNKRGALIDAKIGDADNPERASAGTQFCFVQGKIQTDEDLNANEERINNIRHNWLYHKFKKRLLQEDPNLSEVVNATWLDELVTIMIADTLESLGPCVIPQEHREYYKTKGGVPHLDGSVTIFGEVIEGLDIVEKMSLVKTDSKDRPLQDVWVKSTKVFQK